MSTQKVLETYGETGEMSAETSDKAVKDGFWSMETSSVESVKNVFSGNGTWQDYGGIVLMFATVGEGKKELEDSLSGKVDETNISNNVDEVEGKPKDRENVTAKPQAETEHAPKKGKGEAYENGDIGNNKVGALGESTIVAKLKADGYEVLQIQNNSGHGVDIIARDAKGNVKCIEVKANSSSLSKAQQQGGEFFVNDRLNQAVSNEGHYKIPPNPEQMKVDAETAQKWIDSAPNVDYEVHRVDVDRTTGEVSNHRTSDWEAKKDK